MVYDNTDVIDVRVLNNDVSDLKEISGNLVENSRLTNDNVRILVNKVDSLSGSMGNLTKVVEEIKTEFGNFRDEITTEVDDIKNKTEIDDDQRKVIRKLVSAVVSRRLGINENARKRTWDEKMINQKYCPMFSQTLYSEVSNKGHLASPYGKTIKENYVRACEDIEAWYPREGIAGLKERADENARIRKIAKEQGYA